MILLVGGEKGGTGKSTLAKNLAVFAAQAGKNVCLVDGDPQKTVTKWMERRADRVPQIMSVELTAPKQTDSRQASKGIAPRLQGLAQQYDPVIVDCGGRDSAELRSAMIVADAMVTPFAPSIDDVETVPKILDLVADAEVIRGRPLPVLAVTNLALSNPLAKGVGMVRETFAELGDDITLSENVIYRREAHSRLSNEGLCSADAREADHKAYTEMQFIYLEIFGEE